MFHTKYLETLDKACSIHLKLREQVDINNKDKKLAIYYLQGGCLTQSNVAIKSWSVGDLNSPIRAKRFIDECHKLIMLITAVDDNHRYVKAFFRNEIIDFPNLFDKKNKLIKDRILGKYMWSDDDFKEWDKRRKLLNSGFSKGVHPNLESVAYNSDAKTGEFDYKLQDNEFKCYPIRNFDFAHFIIIPAIDTIINSGDMFIFDGDDIKILMVYRDEIQDIALRLAGYESKK